ncbi:MAG: hypothetical protein KatS3mg014_2215 [Actinomycetota bacterium]|nr:MAG: hypothetical protein KatS3mg014_2215 [Actinomycetota bacterium]
MDVPGFLASHPPFDELTPEELARVLGALEIAHFPPGAIILEEAGQPSTQLYVVRKGVVEILDDGIVIDELGEGEVFGMWSLLGHIAPTATVRAREDTLCYLIGAEVAREILSTRAGAAFVVASFRRREARIREVLEETPPPGGLRPVGSLLRRPPVTCDPETPVAEAAALMARERVSSLLVPGPDGRYGILTDRDLRARVVAERRSPDTPVAEVMTPRARTVPADAMVGEVLLEMIEHGVHHLPVVDRRGNLLGVVTDSDLMGVGRETPFALKSALERAPDDATVGRELRRLPDVVAALVETGTDPVHVGHVVAFAIDAATRRLLELAIAELGGPPAPWAWLALGSAARQEQGIRTDQDHALAVGAEPDAFAGLAGRVVAGLEAGGIPRCNADVMATDPRLRLTLEDWVRRFERWMAEGGPTGSEQLSIIADYRQVVGPLHAEATLDEVLATAPEHPAFVRQLARRALDGRPPIGFVRDLRVEPRGEHAGRIDLKHRGIVIVSNLARAHAARSGVTAKRTLERLRRAEDHGVIDPESRADLEEAFRFLWEVRLRHQVERYRAGLEPDDFVDPHELGSVTRRGLKEAFRVVHRAQRALALELGL